MEPEQIAHFLEAIDKPYGMILVTGPTGSGKTVTLYTALNILNKPDATSRPARTRSRSSVPGDQPGQRQPQDRARLRRRAARLPAPGPGRHHGRRDPRPGNRRDRGEGRPDRPPGALDPAHQRRPADADPARHMGVPPYNVASSVLPDHGAAPGAPALPAAASAPTTCRRRPCSRRASRRTRSTAASRSSGRWAARNATKATGAESASYQVMPMSEDIGRLIMEGGNALAARRAGHGARASPTCGSPACAR